MASQAAFVANPLQPNDPCTNTSVESGRMNCLPGGHLGGVASAPRNIGSGIDDRQTIVTRELASHRSSRRRQDGGRHGYAAKTPPSTIPGPSPSTSSTLRRSVFPDDTWRALAVALNLSERELQIVQAVFDDDKESVIAADLGISSHTVHTHLERLYRKLGVSSRVSLVGRVFVEFLRLRTDQPLK